MRIDIRRDGDRIAIAAGNVAPVLVRQDEKKVARLHWRGSAGSRFEPRLPVARLYDKIT